MSYHDRHVAMLCLAMLSLQAGVCSRARSEGLRSPVGSLGEMLEIRHACRARPWRTYQTSSGLVGSFRDYGNFVREEPERHYVLLDVQGAGCIDRFWCVYKKGRPQQANFDLLVYLDGEDQPRIRMDLNALFDGSRVPFVAPLVGRCGFEDRQSSYSYVPIGFRSSCQVVVVPRDADEAYDWREWDGRRYLLFFYQLTYRLCSEGQNVQPFRWTLTAAERATLERVRTDWRQAGRLPLKATSTSLKSHSRHAILQQPSDALLLDHAGSGTLRETRLRIQRDGISAAEQQRLADALWLEMVWDEADQPQVSAPLGTFFAAPDPNMEIGGLALGCSSGEYYCHLPMPFERRAKVSVRLKQPLGRALQLHAKFLWDPRPPQSDDYLFHARRYDVSGAPDGKNIALLNVQGAGHVVGLVKDRVGDVESDDNWFVDGDQEPSIVGTGTEDFFSFAWGLGDLQALPLHGVRVPFGPPSMRGKRSDTGCCYRFHLPAAYPFRKSLRLTWEHGSENEDRGRYSGVVYYYLPRSGD